MYVCILHHCQEASKPPLPRRSEWWGLSLPLSPHALGFSKATALLVVLRDSGTVQGLQVHLESAWDVVMARMVGPAPLPMLHVPATSEINTVGADGLREIWAFTASIRRPQTMNGP